MALTLVSNARARDGLAAQWAMKHHTEKRKYETKKKKDKSGVTLLQVANTVQAQLLHSHTPHTYNWSWKQRSHDRTPSKTNKKTFFQTPVACRLPHNLPTCHNEDPRPRRSAQSSLLTEATETLTASAGTVDPGCDGCCDTRRLDIVSLYSLGTLLRDGRG